MPSESTSWETRTIEVPEAESLWTSACSSTRDFVPTLRAKVCLASAAQVEVPACMPSVLTLMASLIAMYVQRIAGVRNREMVNKTLRVVKSIAKRINSTTKIAAMAEPRANNTIEVATNVEKNLNIVQVVSNSCLKLHSQEGKDR